MNLSTKKRDGMREALAFLNGVTFAKDEDEFMARVGLMGIVLDHGRCLDDLDDKDKEIEELEQNWAAAEETIVHKDNVIEELEGICYCPECDGRRYYQYSVHGSNSACPCCNTDGKAAKHDAQELAVLRRAIPVFIQSLKDGSRDKDKEIEALKKRANELEVQVLEERQVRGGVLALSDSKDDKISWLLGEIENLKLELVRHQELLDD